MKHAARALAVALVLALLSLQSCGGGDGVSNNWDAMLWDQGMWQ